MSTSTATLPKLRSDAVVQRLSDEDFVVKLPTEREYFSVGAGEAFLRQQFDGIATIDSLLEAFEKEFREEISARDINDFIEIAKARKLRESSQSEAEATPASQAKRFADDEDDGEDYNAESAAKPALLPRQAVRSGSALRVARTADVLGLDSRVRGCFKRGHVLRAVDPDPQLAGRVRFILRGVALGNGSSRSRTTPNPKSCFA